MAESGAFVEAEGKGKYRTLPLILLSPIVAESFPRIVVIKLTPSTTPFIHTTSLGRVTTTVD